MALTQAQIVEALTVGASSAFVEGLSVTTPTWNKIATKVGSTGSAENYGWLKDLPGIKEWVGARMLVELGSHGYQIPNKTYEASIVIKREDLEDDAIGKYGVISNGWGRKIGLFPDQNCYGLLKNGFSTLCFDGQYFFDTDHPFETATPGTFSNVVGDPAATGAPWFLVDNTQILLPIIFQERRPFALEFVGADSEYAFFQNKVAMGPDGRHGYGFGLPQTAVGSKETLNAANFEAGKLLMASYKETDGETPLGTMARLLVVGPSNESAAREILDRANLENGESNINYKNVELHISPYLP